MCTFAPQETQRTYVKVSPSSPRLFVRLTIFHLGVIASKQVNAGKRMLPLIAIVLYSFGLACIVNFFMMRCRLKINAVYVQRAQDIAKAAASTAPTPLHPLKITVLHPDLGIGGAERLIVDLAVGLQQVQLTFPAAVTIVTSHHDPKRCFPETADGTIRVVVRGGFLPTSIFGRARALCATLRMMYAVYATCLEEPDTDVFVVDQIAAAMPPLTYFALHTPILFYCHYPDQLCDPNRNEDRTLKANVTMPGSHQAHMTYRGFFDNLEAWSMKSASSIICNSQFTREKTVSLFPELEDRINEATDIFYPPVHSQLCPNTLALDEDTKALLEKLNSHIAFVSINRYERAKNIALAVRAFWKMLPETANWPKPPLLIIAGGYDPRLPQCVSYQKELWNLAHGTLAIPPHQIIFLQNISNECKAVLLNHMRALLYTPANEHFGIVPVEAMAAGRPVIAVNHGGPCESVENQAKGDEDVGGILCEPTVAAFAEAMVKLGSDADLSDALGMNGARRAKERFSIAQFSDKIATRVLALHRTADEQIVKTFLPGSEQTSSPVRATEITDKKDD